MKTKLIISLSLLIGAIVIWIPCALTYNPLIMTPALIFAYLVGFIGLVYLGLYFKDKLNEK